MLTVIGEEAREVFSTFAADDSAKINSVQKKFEEYCQPCKKVPFERYRFNCRVQESGETYNQYRTALLKIAEGCEFQMITPNEILRDRLVFGIRDNKVREMLLRKSKLTLADTDEICHAAECILAQMKVVDDSARVSVSNQIRNEEYESVGTADADARALSSIWESLQQVP